MTSRSQFFSGRIGFVFCRFSNREEMRVSLFLLPGRPTCPDFPGISLVLAMEVLPASWENSPRKLRQLASHPLLPSFSSVCPSFPFSSFHHTLDCMPAHRDLRVKKGLLAEHYLHDGSMLLFVWIYPNLFNQSYFERQLGFHFLKKL